MASIDDIKEGVSNLLSNLNPNKKTKSKIENIELDIISSKDISRRKSVTNRRTAEGFNIADHAKSEPLIINISVLDNSINYLSNREALISLYDAGDPVAFYYSSRDEYSDVVIEDLRESENYQAENSFRYDITLRKIETSTFNSSTVVVDYKAAKVTSSTKKTTTATNVEATAEEEKKVYNSWLKGGGR